MSATLRTEQQIKEAHQALSDFFYPREVRDWDKPCDECGEEKQHTLTCSKGKHAFQGWTTSVLKTSELDPSQQCCKAGCPNTASMRIRLNIWGSLYEFDVCRVHGMTDEGQSRDGFWCDSL